MLLLLFFPYFWLYNFDTNFTDKSMYYSLSLLHLFLSLKLNYYCHISIYIYPIFNSKKNILNFISICTKSLLHLQIYKFHYIVNQNFFLFSIIIIFLYIHLSPITTCETYQKLHTSYHYIHIKNIITLYASMLSWNNFNYLRFSLPFQCFPNLFF